MIKSKLISFNELDCHASISNCEHKIHSIILGMMTLLEKACDAHLTLSKSKGVNLSIGL
jgi:hypothetical protein